VSGATAGELILGFDTSTDLTTVAVTDRSGERVGGSEHSPVEGERPAHVSDLLPAVERCVETAGGWERIARIGIGVGPGSYTGLRVGVATGRALAQATGREVAAISTLEALAEGARGMPEAEGRSLLTVLDARRRQAFVALFGSDGSVLLHASCVGPEEFGRIVALVPDAPLALGDGSLRFLQELENAGAEVAGPESAAHSVDARHICRLASDAEVTPFDAIEPIYLREPDAKRWIERDTGKTD
jgi:tRNA threonylcarbamoyladenosine biosynthesis protein TsaB